MRLVANDLSLGGRLAGVSATLEPGKIVAICGPNGAGKSSLLAALAGLIAPDAGAVLLDGVPLGDWPANRRAQAIGYLPQQAELAWDVSVETLVRLGRLPWGDQGAEAVEAALAALDLCDLRTRPLSHLSGGERARAMLARVLTGEPRWLLADEPLAALDLAHQLALLETFRRLADRGAGVVLVLHDLALAANHADRVLVLNNGALVANDAPDRALGAAIIAEVWDVKARWLGEPGQHALAIDPIPDRAL